MTTSALSTTNTSVSVPLRQSLVMSVALGEAHPLLAGLFSPDSIGRLVLIVTGVFPERLFLTEGSTILLVFPTASDILSVASKLNHLSSWMGRTVKVQYHKPSGTELQSFYGQRNSWINFFMVMLTTPCMFLTSLLLIHP